MAVVQGIREKVHFPIYDSIIVPANYPAANASASPSSAP